MDIENENLDNTSDVVDSVETTDVAEQNNDFVIKEVTNDEEDSFLNKLVQEESNLENDDTSDNDTSNDDSQEQEEEEQQEEDDFDVVDLDENLAFEFLKKAKGLDVESIDDLLKPRESRKLSPELEKFIEYTEKTGNSNYNDFLATQKDWTQEPKENVLKSFLKTENPTLNEKQIEFLYNKNYNYDEEYDEEDVVMERQINIEKDYQKGLSLLEKQKEEFMVVKGLDETIPEEYREAKSFYDKQQENEKLFQENRNEYLSKVESVFGNDFKGFDVTIGDEKLAIKPENISEAKTHVSDLSNFNNKFFDEKTGKIKDINGLSKAVYFAMNPDKVAEHFFNLGKAKYAENEDKLSKNITTTSRNVAPRMGSGNITVKEV